jgi:hypothetical protein
MSHDEYRGRDNSDPSLTPRMATPATTSGGMGKGICHVKDIVAAGNTCNEIWSGGTMIRVKLD